MSGFSNITGLSDPTTGPGFAGLLQMASFRGVPFKVDSARVTKGRRQALHEYPFRDGGWPEDLGRAMRTYTFDAHLIGDLAPAMQLALDTVLEMPGSGLLIHPSIGAVRVSVLAGATAIQKDSQRVIMAQLQFIEDSGTVFPTAIIATAISVLLLATSGLSDMNTDLGGVAAPAAALGPAVLSEGANVTTAFAASCALGGADPTAIVAMATALPRPDPDSGYGRYAAGSASSSLGEDATVETLQARLADQRAAIAGAGASAAAAAGSFSASTDMMGALAAIVEAMRAGMTDPADQTRVLLGLAGFKYTDGAGGSVGIGAAAAAMRAAMAAACRRAALVSLARAAAAYQPVSYDDAARLRAALAAALDTEMTAAADAGQDLSYQALKQLRAAVVRDLTTRGARLPTVVTVTFAVPMPSLAIAQRLYTDASRADEIAAESGTIHPAFCPTTFRALAA